MNNKMTKQQKRILIAKDVLKLIRLNRFRPQAGIYLSSQTNALFTYRDMDKQAKDIFKEKACFGCAQGAICYAAALRFNEVTVRELSTQTGYVSDGAFADFLQRFFSKYQTGLIEACFEGWYTNKQTSTRISAKAKKWVDKHGFKTDNDRLCIIMRNVAKNGAFKP